MSSTRRADPKSPLSQERYMSSPEFSAQRVVNARAVAKRSSLLSSREEQDLLWFIQGFSLLKPGLNGLAPVAQRIFPELSKGGLNALTEGILKMFPERAQT